MEKLLKNLQKNGFIERFKNVNFIGIYKIHKILVFL